MIDKPTQITSESFREELALAFRKRADDSASLLRALLFALAGGMSGFIASQLDEWTTEQKGLGTLSLVLLAGAIAVLIRSWFLQKDKSLRRYRVAYNEGLEALAKLDEETRESPKRRNEDWDGLACGLILLATIVAGVALFSYA
jgi:hypothetical protein